MNKQLMSLIGIAALTTVYSVPAFAGSYVPEPEPEVVPEPDVDSHKVTICHNPPGNSDKKRSITVSASSVDAHLAHGDVKGECGE